MGNTELGVPVAWANEREIERAIHNTLRGYRMEHRLWREVLVDNLLPDTDAVDFCYQKYDLVYDYRLKTYCVLPDILGSNYPFSLRVLSAAPTVQEAFRRAKPIMLLELANHPMEVPYGL